MTDSRREPVLSIVTITRNRARTLRQAIESVLALRYRDWEYIIVNDGSTDDTEKVILEYVRRCPSLRYVKQKHCGLAESRARGLDFARGRFFALLDDDDLFLPGRFDSHITYLDAHPECALVYSRVDLRNKFSVPSVEYPQEPVLDFEALLDDNRIQVAAVTLRTEALRKLGGFHGSLESCDDYEMWLRVARHYPLAFIPETVGCYIWHDSNMSLDEKRDYRSLMRIFASLAREPLPPALLRRIHARCRGLNKKLLGAEPRPQEDGSEACSASLVVCTRDRIEGLKDTLAAFAAQRLPEGKTVEILVIDNDPRGQAMAAVFDFAAESPFPVRYFHEPGDGLSAARNRALREARGEILLFTDDDVIPDLDWLYEMSRAYESSGAGVLGGPVRALWEKKPVESLLGCGAALSRLALLDRGPDPVEIRSFDGDMIYGANMVLDRREALRAGGFSPLFDTSRVQRGGDTEIIYRILRPGAHALYVPAAAVLHRIPAHRTRKRYLCRVSFHGGRAKAILFRGSYPFSMRLLLETAGRALPALFGRGGTSALEALLLTAEQLGYCSAFVPRSLTSGPAPSNPADSAAPQDSIRAS